MGYNNPTEEALNEMQKLHRGDVLAIASFGTGKPPPSSPFRRHIEGMDLGRSVGATIDHVHRLFKTATGVLTDCEKTHKTVKSRIGDADVARRIQYFRLNPETGPNKVKLDEWKSSRANGKGGKGHTLERLENCVKDEIEERDMDGMIERLALLLVSQRRRRIEEDRDRWERFACCTYYKCNEENHTQYELRRDMRRHLSEVHHVGADLLANELNNCRRQPEFAGGPF